MHAEVEASRQMHKNRIKLYLFILLSLSAQNLSPIMRKFLTDFTELCFYYKEVHKELIFSSRIYSELAVEMVLRSGGENDFYPLRRAGVRSVRKTFVCSQCSQIPFN